jgi:hypothetical protein
MTDINPERAHKHVFNIGRADGTYSMNFIILRASG